jgi:membrane associated rhomboid family serine protease
MFPLRDDQPSYSTPYVTYFLIGLNLVIFFLWEATSARAYEAALRDFSLVPQYTARAFLGLPSFSISEAVLRIFTSMFIHGDWWHVVGNMWMLWIFGDNIEDYLGHFPYLVFYFVCGVVAALSHVLLNPNSTARTIGASGAIAGVMGAYLILYPRARVLVWIFVLIIYVPAWLMLGVWGITQFVNGAAGSVQAGTQGGGVAFWAHVGGFVAGIVLVKLFPQRTQRERYAAW